MTSGAGVSAHRGTTHEPPPFSVGCAGLRVRGASVGSPNLDDLKAAGGFARGFVSGFPRIPGGNRRMRGIDADLAPPLAVSWG